MKKRIMSILLTLCMVLMLCPVTAFADDYYTVTVNFQYGTMARISEAENPHTFTVAENETFILTEVENCSPYEFVGWKESVSGTVYEPWESFDAANLTFDAVYQVQGSLAITLDGFEVGKTPNDCTFTFESTIPGITFSEDDIQHIRCSKFVFINEEDDEWLPMDETEAFEAGARYWIGISLNNKGLELAPAVTVNGKTPEYCTIATSNGVPIQLQIDCYPSTPAEQSQYTITYDGGEGVEGSIPAGTKTHGTDFTLSSETFTMDGFVQTGWATSDGGEKVYDLGGTYTTNEDITLYPVWSDITKPTGEISIGTKSWKTFLNNITFGLFFKDTQTVTITAGDNSGEDVTIEYLLSDKELTVDQLNSATFTTYNGAFSINPDNKYVIYAKLTDKSGNVAYINSEGIVLDKTAPVISGIENGKVYCDAVEFTVTDSNGVESVKAGSTELTEANGKYTLAKGIGTVTVVATDNTGNITKVTVTVNNGHTYGAWQSNGNDTHIRHCTVTGCDGYEDGNCEGGQASYFNKAVCDTCHTEYGELLTDTTAPIGEITIGTNKWNSFLNTITFGIFFKNTQSVTVTATDDSYTHAGYTDDKAVKVEYYLYSGDTALTQADLASKTFTAYDDTFNINPDNKYVVYARLTDHAGNVTYISSNGIVLDATAPVITGVENGKTYCESQTVTVTEEYIESVKVNGTDVTLDENNQFTLNPAEGTQTIVATDKAGNVSADITVTVNNGHIDNDKDHKCDFCGTTLSSHTGGTATCTAKAICEYCGKEYGEIDSSNHNLEKISANNATVTATGNKEYWHCKDCSKYFADENGTNEIKLDDTVIAKLPPEIIDGKGQSITESESKELTFRSNAAFSDLIRVELDGKTLDEKNYTATEGSTIITLKADYVATLSVGEHTIGIVSASGTATTTFTINAKPVVETTVPTQTEPETTVPAQTENETTVPAQTENEATVSSQSENDSMTSPETGNESNMALLLIFLISCGGVIVVTGAYSKRKKHSAK